MVFVINSLKDKGTKKDQEKSEMSTPAFSSPPPADGGGASVAGIIVGLVVLVIIGIISLTCAKMTTRAIVTDLQARVAPPPPPTLNVVRVWEIDCANNGEVPPRIGEGQTVKVLNRSLDRGAEQQFMAEGGGGMPELVMPRKNESMDWFPKYVWDEFEKGELGAMILSCGIEENEREKGERMAMVALWCVQDSPEARPPMSAVVKMLEGGVEVKPPPKPFHYLYSVGVNVLNILNSSDCTSSEGTNTYWYKETTPVMAKYEIQMASSG
ncbi:hypothetical protein HYC85_027467 [Camellia sinensis]|uniref:Uncharacterized protein n=1 Tax=Camellia sinensis TaxID=4442 RepID=A0A7J7GA70_CAMSI|nr:hypothetical protein HYC85_027467 [Camellia sinensis]